MIYKLLNIMYGNKLTKHVILTPHKILSKIPIKFYVELFLQACTKTSK